MAVDPSTPPTTLGPSNLLGTMIKALYTSANTMVQNFGFTIPQAAMFLGGVAAILIVWSMIASLRNRKNFSLVDLEDDSDGKLPESNGNVRGRILRPESRPEGSKGALV
jgi:hypothetical protein